MFLNSFIDDVQNVFLNSYFKVVLAEIELFYVDLFGTQGEAKVYCKPRIENDVINLYNSYFKVVLADIVSM